VGLGDTYGHLKIPTKKDGLLANRPSVIPLPLGADLLALKGTRLKVVIFCHNSIIMKCIYNVLT
jgi:hypothetical protein